MNSKFVVTIHPSLACLKKDAWALLFSEPEQALESARKIDARRNSSEEFGALVVTYLKKPLLYLPLSIQTRCMRDISDSSQRYSTQRFSGGTLNMRTLSVGSFEPELEIAFDRSTSPSLLHEAWRLAFVALEAYRFGRKAKLLAFCNMSEESGYSLPLSLCRGFITIPGKPLMNADGIRPTKTLYRHRNLLIHFYLRITSVNANTPSQGCTEPAHLGLYWEEHPVESGEPLCELSEQASGM